MREEKQQVCSPETAEVLERIRMMMGAVEIGEPLLRPGVFWKEIARQNVDMIRRNGIDAFKRCISQNYFNWAVQGPGDPQMNALLREWVAEPSAVPFDADLVEAAGLESLDGASYLRTASERRAYTLFVGLLWWFSTRKASSDALRWIEEPRFGQPLDIRIGGRAVSQDLANSIREYEHFQQLLQPKPGGEPPVFAEVGAGYGRLGFLTHRARGARIWIFDIPPALAISEWYLSKTFPKARIFKWRAFSHWEEIQNELAAADIAIFTIDQLPLVPPKSIDVFAAISVLHEMPPAQCARVFDLMAETARAIFTKNWTEWPNSADGYVFRSDALTAPPGWTTTLSRADPVIPAFTEKLFAA